MTEGLFSKMPDELTTPRVCFHIKNGRRPVNLEKPDYKRTMPVWAIPQRGERFRLAGAFYEVFSRFYDVDGAKIVIVASHVADPQY